MRVLSNKRANKVQAFLKYKRENNMQWRLPWVNEQESRERTVAPDINHPERYHSDLTNRNGIYDWDIYKMVEHGVHGNLFVYSKIGVHSIYVFSEKFIQYHKGLILEHGLEYTLSFVSTAGQEYITRVYSDHKGWIHVGQWTHDYETLLRRGIMDAETAESNKKMRDLEVLASYLGDRK